jgi:hypothetical protein
MIIGGDTPGSCHTKPERHGAATPAAASSRASRDQRINIENVIEGLSDGGRYVGMLLSTSKLVPERRREKSEKSAHEVFPAVTCPADALMSEPDDSTATWFEVAASDVVDDVSSLGVEMQSISRGHAS